MDREKVIEELERLSEWFFLQYQVVYDGDAPDYYDAYKTVDDALALLKEQEAIPCGEKIKTGDVVLDFYECGYCKNAIRKPWKYCPFCGKAVKWE